MSKEALEVLKLLFTDSNLQFPVKYVDQFLEIKNWINEQLKELPTKES